MFHAHLNISPKLIIFQQKKKPGCVNTTKKHENAVKE